MSYIDDIPALPKNQVVTAHLGRVTTPRAPPPDRRSGAAIPGVTAAGAGQLLPRLYPPPRPTAVEPSATKTAQAPQPAPSHAVANGYLEAIGARPLAGRLFTAIDFVEGAQPVVVVNEPFARSFLGGRNAIGRRIRIEQPRADVRTGGSHGTRSSAWCPISG